MFAASTARISMDAKKVMASAGSGKSCFLLRLHQVTDLSTDGTIGSVAVHWLRLWHALPLRPNPLQRLTGLPLAQESCQFPFPKNAADPPDLQNAKNKGDQTQLEVSRVKIFNQPILPL